MSKKDIWPREKNSKHLYTRSAKLGRAQQLGVDHPKVSERELLDVAQVDLQNGKRNVLFVCSKNQWRSPTAENVWRRHPSLNVRSGGTSPSARHTVSVEDVLWADIILVMEEKHKSRLKAEYARALQHKLIHVIDIPDEYKYMDPELVTLLTSSVESVLGLIRRQI
jgi:predicted protein tyrosine phosphatase